MNPLPLNLVNEIADAAEKHNRAYLNLLDWCHDEGPEDHKERKLYPEYIKLDAIEEKLRAAFNLLLDRVKSEYNWCIIYPGLGISREEAKKQILSRWQDAVLDEVRIPFYYKHKAIIAGIKNNLGTPIQNVRELEIGKFYLDFQNKAIQVTRKTHNGKRVFAGDRKLENGRAASYLDHGNGYQELSEEHAQKWIELCAEFKALVEGKKSLQIV